MRDEKFLVRSLFFSSRTSENARTSDLVENERQNLFFNSKQKKAKILPKRLLLLLFKEEQVSLFRSKIQKNSKRILQNRENNEKSKKKKKSVGKELDTSLCCADLYSPLSLKIKCSRLREEGLPLRNEEDNEDIEAFSEVVLSPLKKKQTTF